MRRYMNDRGSLLIEVMIAMLLLTMSLIPLLGSLTAAAKVSNVSKEQTQVSFLLQKESEYIKANYREDNFEKLPVNVTAAVYENYSDSGFTLYRTVSEIEVLGDDGEPALDSEYVKNIEIVIDKDGRTYGRVSFLLYKLGI